MCVTLCVRGPDGEVSDRCDHTKEHSGSDGPPVSPRHRHGEKQRFTTILPVKVSHPESVTVAVTVFLQIHTFCCGSVIRVITAKSVRMGFWECHHANQRRKRD